MMATVLPTGVSLRCQETLPRRRKSILTKRETEISCLLPGMTNREIGEHLGISEGIASLMEEATKLAQQIVANSGMGVQMSKVAINRGRNADLDTGLSIELLAWRSCEVIRNEDEWYKPC